MLTFVQNFFAPKVSPIGGDFGTDSLRMAQVNYSGGEWKLIAAASADVPMHVRNNFSARIGFFVETAPPPLAPGTFPPRPASLRLPASGRHSPPTGIAPL